MAIKVYSTPTCPWCIKVKGYLKDKEIDFKDVDVSSDHDAAKEMIEKSGQMGVPVLDINGAIIIGFDKDAIDRELAKETKK
jgi:glutaredoxin 3